MRDCVSVSYERGDDSSQPAYQRTITVAMNRDRYMPFVPAARGSPWVATSAWRWGRCPACTVVHVVSRVIGYTMLRRLTACSSVHTTLHSYLADYDCPLHIVMLPLATRWQQQRGPQWWTPPQTCIGSRRGSRRDTTLQPS